MIKKKVCAEKVCITLIFVVRCVRVGSPIGGTTKLVKYEKPDAEFLKAVSVPAFLHAFGGVSFIIN